MMITFGDIGTLVVAAKQEKVLGKLDLVAEQKQHVFQRLLATIHIVAQKQVVAAGRESSHLKQSDKVGILAMGIAYDLDGRRQFQQ